jgi:hypothetical protein
MRIVPADRGRTVSYLSMDQLSSRWVHRTKHEHDQYEVIPSSRKLGGGARARSLPLRQSPQVERRIGRFFRRQRFRRADDALGGGVVAGLVD